jgi:aldose 1-epimerase
VTGLGGTPPLVLEGGDGWRAAILPGQGAAMAALTVRGDEVLKPLPPGADPNRGFHGAFWMLPWANRLDGGRILVAGAEHRMPINRPEEDTAIHGLSRDRAWRVEEAEATPDRAVLVQELELAPFRCAARLEVSLGPDGCGMELTLRNLGAVATPLGFGWHPFFLRTPGTRLRFAATTAFRRDHRGLPVAPADSPGLDAPVEEFDGLDAHFAGWDGVAEILRPGLAPLRMEASGAWAGNLQVFAPAGGDVLCVEPMSHAPDAPNRPTAARHGAMTKVAPGASLHAGLRLRASR